MSHIVNQKAGGLKSGKCQPTLGGRSSRKAVREKRKARRLARGDTVEIGSEVVLAHEGGRKFYHKHLSPKAKARKKKARKTARKARSRK